MVLLSLTFGVQLVRALSLQWVFLDLENVSSLKLR